MSNSTFIGTLGEKSLHAALKAWCARDGDLLEVEVDGSVIDIVRGETLIEIQTRHFYAMKRKLEKLLGNGKRVHLVYPVPQKKWIVRETAAGELISRRRSPKRGRVIDVFRELVRIPTVVVHQGFSLEVLLTYQEEVWRDDGQGSWRRKGWSVYDHRLLDVVEKAVFRTPGDYLRLIPDGPPRPFTNRELAEALGCRVGLAQKMTYTLRGMGVLEVAGKWGRVLTFVEKLGL